MLRLHLLSFIILASINLFSQCFGAVITSGRALSKRDSTSIPSNMKFAIQVDAPGQSIDGAYLSAVQLNDSSVGLNLSGQDKTSMSWAVINSGRDSEPNTANVPAPRVFSWQIGDDSVNGGSGQSLIYNWITDVDYVTHDHAATFLHFFPSNDEKYMLPLFLWDSSNGNLPGMRNVTVRNSDYYQAEDQQHPKLNITLEPGDGEDGNQWVYCDTGDDSSPARFTCADGGHCMFIFWGPPDGLWDDGSGKPMRCTPFDLRLVPCLVADPNDPSKHIPQLSNGYCDFIS